MVRERTPLSYALATPFEGARAARQLIGEDLDREVFGVLLVDIRNRVTAMHVVSMGDLSGTLVHPREVFKCAILGSAAAIIAFHNHPSGDPAPSREDIALTKRLVDDREAPRHPGSRSPGPRAMRAATSASRNGSSSSEETPPARPLRWAKRPTIKQRFVELHAPAGISE